MLARRQGLDDKSYLAGYDSATFFKKLGLGIETGPTGTNVADVSLVLVINPNDPHRKVAFVFGGEATVKVTLPEGQQPGHGGRNTHLVLLGAEKLNQLGSRKDESIG
jgi:glycerate-2-kinase